MDLRAALKHARNAVSTGAIFLSDHAENDKLPLLGIELADVQAVIESASDGEAQTDDGMKWKFYGETLDGTELAVVIQSTVTLPSSSPSTPTPEDVMTTKTITRKIAGRVFSVDVPAVTHAEHGLMVSLRDGMKADLAIAVALATEGPATPDAFRFMRKAIGLSAKAVAELLTVTPVTVSRWENEARELDPLAWFALGTLVLDRAGKPQEPQVRMQRLDGSYKPPKEKHVDL